MDNKTNKQTDAKPDGRETGNAVPPAPESDPLQSKINKAVESIKKSDPKAFKSLQVVVAGKLVGDAVDAVNDIPDEAYEQLIAHSKAKGLATADAVAFVAQALLDVKHKLGEYAMQQKHHVIKQLGEDKIRQILGDEETADHFLKS